MSKTIEVTLDDHCNKVIQTELDSGEYEGVSDVIHEALIILEKKKAMAKLDTELQKGIDSGFDHNFSYPEWLKSVKQRYK